MTARKEVEQRTSTGPTKARKTRWVRIGALSLVVLAIGGGAVFGYSLDRDSNLVETPLIGTSAPTREVPRLERRDSLSLADLRGQIVVVNFWASWCVPCREEHPALVAAASAYQDAGVRFVGVVYQDRESSAVRFLDELGRGEGYIYATDPQARLALDFGVFGIPETFFIDRQGRIAAKITGASTLPLLASVLDDMVAGDAPRPNSNTGPVQSEPSS